MPSIYMRAGREFKAAGQSRFNCMNPRPCAVIAPGAVFLSVREFAARTRAPDVILQPQAGPSADHVDGGGALLLEEPEFPAPGAWHFGSRHILKREGLLVEMKTAGYRHGFRVLGVRRDRLGRCRLRPGGGRSSSVRGRDGVGAAAAADGLIRATAGLVGSNDRSSKFSSSRLVLAPTRSFAQIRMPSPRLQRAAEWWVLKRAGRHARCRTECLRRSGSPRRRSRSSQGRLRACYQTIREAGPSALERS